MLRNPVNVRNLGKLLNLLNISKFTVVRNSTDVRNVGNSLNCLHPLFGIIRFIMVRNLQKARSVAST